MFMRPLLPAKLLCLVPLIATTGAFKITGYADSHCTNPYTHGVVNLPTGVCFDSSDKGGWGSFQVSDFDSCHFLLFPNGTHCNRYFPRKTIAEPDICYDSSWTMWMIDCEHSPSPSPSPLPAPSSASSPGPKPKRYYHHAAAVAGGVAGGLSGLFLLIGLEVILIIRRSRRHARAVARAQAAHLADQIELRARDRGESSGRDSLSKPKTVHVKPETPIAASERPS
ncbi:uncharacterized protein BDR25DRAFT_375281 [Lindgomyces ingoldianus]|uniref:Uncharacterized protein n=1 Tax=Lindgomyces ingoldianus TaxID=673940 RepID=A0ACB6RDG1_9PLEO|nr:uncharacterized protein BDR25DRAFT_375281 [Lindgomyces ingoldianus]KAF2476360.1 hypothetical protein BDR25DRAFT_375281 [Lindgomyces ingoldianus]